MRLIGLLIDIERDNVKLRDSFLFLTGLRDLLMLQLEMFR